MSNEEFEWDRAKADANFQKHGVDFDVAMHVFDDSFVFIELDYSNSTSEDRYTATGQVVDALLTVIYTERGYRIRIISARKASNDERRKYHRGQSSR
jgi:uncharacterized protein